MAAQENVDAAACRRTTLLATKVRSAPAEWDLLTEIHCTLIVQEDTDAAEIYDGTWAAACRRTTLLANLAVVMKRTDERVSSFTVVIPQCQRCSDSLLWLH